MSQIIESSLAEKRVFKPATAFSKAARIKSLADYRKLYAESIKSPEKFWAREASELKWQKKWTKVLEWKAPFAKWFLGGKINMSENCVDRHALDPVRKNKAAIIFEGEPGDVRTLTYLQLHREVCRAANMLKANGVKAKDRVIIYMPMVPEAVIAMLACTRLGAVHSVIFGGFSANAIYDRVLDSQATHVITADGGWRRGKIVPLKDNVDAALMCATTVKRVIVLSRTGQDINMTEGRDVWWHDEIAKVDADCPAKGFDSEHPLYILYTSGSTGKPKGILHTTGGYAVGVYSTSKYIFDLRDEDVYWCTADVGWVTGHSYIAYGPLLNGATVLMYEGAPDTPHFGRFWELLGQNFTASAPCGSLRLAEVTGAPFLRSPNRRRQSARPVDRSGLQRDRGELWRRVIAHHASRYRRRARGRADPLRSSVCLCHGAACRAAARGAPGRGEALARPASRAAKRTPALEGSTSPRWSPRHLRQR